MVNHLADRVAVLYLGRLVEVAPRAELFAHPVAPLHRGAAGARCRASADAPPRAVAIQGEMPSPLDPPPGCVFHPRCPKAQAICRVDAAAAGTRARDGRTQLAACHFKA